VVKLGMYVLLMWEKRILVVVGWHCTSCSLT